MKSEEKTNVMRLLDGRKIPYSARTYEPDATMTGEQIALLLGEDPDRVYKTLVTEGKPGRHYVFVIPVRRELDLKKAAKAAGEKSVSMIRQKDRLCSRRLLPRGDEETLPHLSPRNRGKRGPDLRQRRQGRLPGRCKPEGPRRAGPFRLCGSDRGRLTVRGSLAFGARFIVRLHIRAFQLLTGKERRHGKTEPDYP